MKDKRLNLNAMTITVKLVGSMQITLHQYEHHKCSSCNVCVINQCKI
jgi:hypothetical protein